MDEAERAKVEFQRNLTKYVGAPLLGAFSVAAGGAMIASAFSGATVTGLPLSILIGGNPLLNGIWFFANGVICISEGYKFFMIALADQDEVAKVVREIRGSAAGIREEKKTTEHTERRRKDTEKEIDRVESLPVRPLSDFFSVSSSSFRMFRGFLLFSKQD